MHSAWQHAIQRRNQWIFSSKPWVEVMKWKQMKCVYRTANAFANWFHFGGISIGTDEFIGNNKRISVFSQALRSFRIFWKTVRILVKFKPKSCRVPTFTKLSVCVPSRNSFFWPLLTTVTQSAIFVFILNRSHCPNGHECVVCGIYAIEWQKRCINCAFSNEQHCLVVKCH